MMDYIGIAICSICQDQKVLIDRDLPHLKQNCKPNIIIHF